MSVKVACLLVLAVVAALVGETGAASSTANSHRRIPTKVRQSDRRTDRGPDTDDKATPEVSENKEAPNRQNDFREYRLWSAQDIATDIRRWAEHYPNVLRVTTAQEAYGLPTAGNANDCSFETKFDDYNAALGVGCRNYILTIQDFVAHPDGSASSKRLPEVFWSGELHGNERVGPTSVMEATQLLLDAATCEELPRLSIQPTSQNDAMWQRELQRARECRLALHSQYGLTDAHRQWLARLVTTRRILVVPTANALGYDQSVREENGIDPNRDFPYDKADVTQCMQTIAARTVNEIFQRHLIQLSLTFHGGMEVIGYEWGAPHWQTNGGTPPSPDDAAQAAIAQAYSRFAGGWAGTSPYQTGPMNDIVYPVQGGMEDWAYAGSWDTDRVKQCQPTTYNGYPAARTVYDSSTLRMFNMLVETSNDKIPTSHLGTSQDILVTMDHNGHVARNLRLALLAAELVEPYVAFRTVNDMTLSDDLIPFLARGGTTCQTTHGVVLPHATRDVTVSFEVGGGLTVDHTAVYYAKWDAALEALLDCQVQPDMATLMPRLKPAVSIGATTGTTRFSSGGSTSLFSATINLDKTFVAGDKIAVLAVARLDQAWGTRRTDVAPPLGPQSHVANVRTDPSWYHTKPDGSAIIQGRLDWVSVPLTLILDQSASTTTHALSIRYDESLILPAQNASAQTTKPNASVQDEIENVTNWTLIALVLVAAVVVVVILGRAYVHHTMRQSHRDRVREFIQDESAVSPGLQQIAAVMGKNGSKGGYTDVGDSDKGVELDQDPLCVECQKTREQLASEE